MQEDATTTSSTAAASLPATAPTPAPSTAPAPAPCAQNSAPVPDRDRSPLPTVAAAFAPIDSGPCHAHVQISKDCISDVLAAASPHGCKPHTYLNLCRSGALTPVFSAYLQLVPAVQWPSQRRRHWLWRRSPRLCCSEAESSRQHACRLGCTCHVGHASFDHIRLTIAAML